MPEQNEPTEPDGPQPSLKPTTLSTLFVAGLATAALMLILATRYYEYFPTMSWFTPVLLIAVAVLLVYLARHTKSRIERKPGYDPVEPLLFARFAALAKACAVGGAVMAGAYGGLLVYTTAQRRLAAAAADLPVVAFGMGVCLVLVAAAMWLEHSCRIPPEDEESDERSTGDGASHA
ncbi:MAG TPA: DUF3180 domain-containing protein [Candidatus Stackebrandtia excrementipullorum]|nr:DUF3180 domain-containing protein [Candidatus Stackebrandtia excrementipullorum]